MQALFTTLLTASLLSSAPYLEKIETRRDFDLLARVYGNGDFANLPHLQVILDRAPGGKIYFVNAKRFPIHRDFLASQGLTQETGKDYFVHSYIAPDRRFVLATLAFQPSIQRYTLEIWEGDLATAEIISQLHARAQAAFFAPLAFKPNSSAQEKLVRGIAGLPVVTPTELWQARDEIAFNRGVAVGTLRWVARLEEGVALGRQDIAVFGETPLSLPAVAGLVTTSGSSPLSHVHVLAHGWGIPDVFVRQAAEKWRPLFGKVVRLEARQGAVTIREATAEEALVRTAAAPRVPKADLSFTELPALDAQRAADAVRVGAKSANLGEVAHAGFRVPPGFAIPFAYFDRFRKKNGLDQAVEALLKEAPEVRRRGLAALRDRFTSTPIDPADARRLLARRHELLGDQGVFVRSSTNAEDLPGFSGAGLYSTVPNARTDDAFLAAVKTVWASIWNDAAYEAREREGVDHRAVMAAVLVQQGVDAEAAGVMLTANPFDTADRDVVYLNAKRGLGLRVVEGRKVPEQLLFDVRKRTVRVLARSGDDAMLSFAPDGGVREVKIEPGRQVLTDAVVFKLADAAVGIRAVFGGRAQDIEWVVAGGVVMIVQARPL